jgi:hypothetical protein
MVPLPPVLEQRLKRLTEQKSWADLLLTALALLERRMRTEDLPTTLPLNATGGVMKRLQTYFGSDFSRVIEAVSIRHNLLQNLQVDTESLRSAALGMAELARPRYGLPMQNDG